MPSRCSSNLSESHSSNVACIRGGGVTTADGPGQERAEPLHSQAPVDGMTRGWGHVTGPGTREVVAHGVEDGQQGSQEAAQQGARAE